MKLTPDSSSSFPGFSNVFTDLFKPGKDRFLENYPHHYDSFTKQFQEGEGLPHFESEDAAYIAFCAYFGEEDDPLLWENLSLNLSNGMGVLHFAALGGQDSLIQRLVRNPTTCLLDQKGATHYHYLAQAGHVELLKERGYSCMLKKDSEGLSVLDYALIHSCKEAIAWCSKRPDLFPEAAAMLQPLPITRETVPILRILHSGYFPEIASLEEISPLFTSLSKAVLSADSQPEAHLLPLYNKFCTILYWAQEKATDPLLALKTMEKTIQNRLNTAKDFIDTYPDLKERVFRDEFLWTLLNYSEIDQNSRKCLATQALCSYYGKEEGAQYVLFPDGTTPLHFAAAGGQKELLEKLLNDTHFRTLSKEGSPFEQYLVKGGHLPLVEQYISSEFYNDFMQSLSSIAFIYNRREVLSYFAHDKGWPEAKLYLLLFDDLGTAAPEGYPFKERLISESSMYFVTLISSIYSPAQIDALSASEIVFLEKTFNRWVQELKKDDTVAKLSGSPLPDRLQDLQTFLEQNSIIIKDLRRQRCLNNPLPLLRALNVVAFPNRHEGQFTDAWELLGEGSFGTVHRVSKKEVPDQNFAVKIPFSRITNSIESDLQWLNYLKAAAAPQEESLFVHKIATCFTLSGRLSLVLELCETSLEDELHKNFQNGMPIDIVHKIALQYIQCLQFFKKHGVIHADLKPANTLLRFGGAFQISICDFGTTFASWSPLALGLSHTPFGTLSYQAPEILAGKPPYGHALDMFSVAAIIVELITGSSLFPYQDGTTEQWLLQEHVLEKLYPPEMRDELSSEYADEVTGTSLQKILKTKGLNGSSWEQMLLRMLEFNPEDRAVPDDLLRAPPLYEGKKRVLQL